MKPNPQNIFLKAIYWLVYSNVWIAICAVSSLFYSYLIFGQSLQIDKLSLWVFSCTLFTYTLHRFVGDKWFAFKTDEREPIRKVISKIYPFQLIFFSILIGVIFFQFDWSFMPWLLLPAIFVLFYGLPIYKKAGKLIRLRDLPFIKIGLIAIIWAYVTVVLPIVYFEIQFTGQLLSIFMERVVFILAITLPFDIRDIKFDTEKQVKTIATVFEIKKSLFFSKILLILFLLLSIFNYFDISSLLIVDYKFCFLWSNILVSIMIWCFLKKKIEELHDLWFTFYLDGTMFAILLISIFVSLF